MWRSRTGRPHFAARDDLFQRGVLAGLAPGMPAFFRRLLYPVDPSGYLPSVRVHPIRSPSSAKTAQLLARLPADTALADALPSTLAARFAERGVTRAGEALRRPDLSDLLWTDAFRDEAPAARAFWQRRAHDAAADVRTLTDVVRAGEPLLLFPEGRPSPDGSIGPLQRGVELLLRRGRPESVLPIGLAYDPLTRGKTRALMAVGREFAPPQQEAIERVLDALRSATPLTCGQVVAHRVLQGEDRLRVADLERALAAAVGRAAAEGRQIDTPLATAEARRARLSDCLAALVQTGVAENVDSRSLRIDQDLAASHGDLRRLATEYESARVSQADPAETR